MESTSNRKKYLAKNTALFALNSVGTNMITFFLVPIYTAALSTSDYGTADLVSTIATVLVPIMTLNIGEAVMRFSLDENADYNKIMSVGIVVAIASMCVGACAFPIIGNIQSLKTYGIYIVLYCVTQGIYQIAVCYLRGTEQLTYFAIGNIIHVIATASFNILFLIVFKMGLPGYFTAYILGYIVGTVYAVFKGKILNVLRKFEFDISLEKAMVRYSIVLVPTSLMWWIMNSSDRIMVTAMVGIAANGIYAVSYKVPTIVSTMSTVFNQAWSYSAIKESKSKDSEEFNNRMFNSFFQFQILVTSGLLLIIRPFIKVYVSAAYYESWKYTPYLLVGYFFMSLGTFLSTSYTVHKDSRGFLISGMAGAIINVALNSVLIPVIGVAGAALATCVSYFSVFAYRVVDTRKYVKIKIVRTRYLLGIGIMILMASTLIFDFACSGLFLILEFVMVLFLEKDYIFKILKLAISVAKRWLYKNNENSM